VGVIDRDRYVRGGVALAIVGVLMVAGCSHRPPGPGTSTTRPTVPAGSVLDGTNWVLLASSLGVPVPEGVVVTATFAARRVTGSSGCNLFFADASADPAHGFVIGDIGSTDRACEEAVGAVEADYLTRLAGARSYVLVGDELHLSGVAGTLRFVERVPGREPG
jgi:heat shock protein HslJ